LVNRKENNLSDDELLPKIFELIEPYPDAKQSINIDTPKPYCPVSPTAWKLQQALWWADAILAAEPITIENFPRWAQHVAVFKPGRYEELLAQDSISETAKKSATRIINVAWKLGIRGVERRPTSRITYAELWNIIDALVAAAAKPTTELGQVSAQNHRRRGRRPKAEMEATRMAMLGTASANPTLINDVPTLARLSGVDPKTARRWIKAAYQGVQDAK
jgi:hypothetical protein